MVQMDATESPPSSREEEEQIEPSLRPRRTRDDILNPENVREEKLRSKDVLDDVLNAVGVLLSFFFLNLFPPFAGENFEFIRIGFFRGWMHRRARSIERVKRRYSLFISPFFAFTCTRIAG